MKTEIARFVRWVASDEATESLVNDAKGATWVLGVEHALVSLTTGQLAMVRGGRDGIDFSCRGDAENLTIHLTIDEKEYQVSRIEWHTHPLPTGPSDSDRKVLAILKQDQSRIYEIRGELRGTLYTPKSGPRVD